jgi:hypothetical protein
MIEFGIRILAGKKECIKSMNDSEDLIKGGQKYFFQRSYLFWLPFDTSRLLLFGPMAKEQRMGRGSDSLEFGWEDMIILFYGDRSSAASFFSNFSSHF